MHLAGRQAVEAKTAAARGAREAEERRQQESLALVGGLYRKREVDGGRASAVELYVCAVNRSRESGDEKGK